jgi:hypothetical protein
LSTGAGQACSVVKGTCAKTKGAGPGLDFKWDILRCSNPVMNLSPELKIIMKIASKCGMFNIFWHYVSCLMCIILFKLHSNRNYYYYFNFLVKILRLREVR